MAESSLKQRGWKKIKSAPLDGTRVHLWMDIYASPMSFGMADAFAVPDCWRDGDRWAHVYRGEPAELDTRYITHWRPATDALDGEEVWRA